MLKAHNNHERTRKTNMWTSCVKNLSWNNKRTTSAEDTQNQHYQWVLTVVNSFPNFLLVLKITGMVGVHTPPRPG